MNISLKFFQCGILIQSKIDGSFVVSYALKLRLKLVFDGSSIVLEQK